MKALVIGGTLFIGRRLVTRLLEEGHDVTVLHRGETHSYGSEVGNLVADRNDPAAVKQALAGQQFDWVFDNVYDWQHGTTAAQVIGTARACGDNLSRYVFMSSCASYGDGLDVTEDAPLAPDDHPESYVANKAASERALLGLHAEEGFPAVTFRPPYVYGPGNPFYREQYFWDRMADGRKIIVPGDGSRLMHFVFVHDLAEACLLAAQRDEASGHGFNVGQTEPITQEELVGALGEAAGVEPEIVHVPRETIEAAGGEVMGDKLYFGFYFDMPPITEDVSKAERILGLTPTPFADALAETFEWYRTNHQRPEIDYAFEDSLLP
jgi:nucleoside-diphosphate-sugar epimerase